MLFNPEESIDFNGNTGPFIQYTYARIRSILRKAEDRPTPNPSRDGGEEASAELASGNASLPLRGSEGNSGLTECQSAQSDRSISPMLRTDNLEGSALLSEKEISLIQQLAAFGAAVQQAGSDYNVSVIANYCYDLAKEFNGFYHDYQILKEPDEQKRAVRLALCEAVAKVIKTGMGLLGIEVPERM
jgi:arginyl-tRNA synthetase